MDALCADDAEILNLRRVARGGISIIADQALSLADGDAGLQLDAHVQALLQS